MTSPSASVRSPRSCEDRARLGSVTVQVKVSVSVTVPSLTVTSTRGLPELAELRVPLIAPVAVLMRQPVRQAGGGVGQRVAVGIGGVGIEADQVTLGVGAVVQVLVEGRILVGVGHRPAEGVGGVDACPSRTVTLTVWAAAAALRLMVPLMSPVAVSIDSPPGSPLAA